MRYTVHSSNSDKIEIRLIENGFVVSYKYGLKTKEEYVKDLHDLNIFLKKYYRGEE